jgi:hypothetical protein
VDCAGILSDGDQSPTLHVEADKISGMYWRGSRSRSKRLYLLLDNIVILAEYFKYRSRYIVLMYG